MAISFDLSGVLRSLWYRIFPKKPGLDIKIAQCYHYWNNQPISTIYMVFLVHNRGEIPTTIYAVDLLHMDPDDYFSAIYTPYCRLTVDIPVNKTKEFRVQYSFPGIELGRESIALKLKVSHTHDDNIELKCISNFVE